MIQAVEERVADIQRLCRQHSVQYLSLFGSAASGEGYTENSDLDFLVEIRPTDAGAYADAYFGLRESLERLFERPVDLVVGSAIKNPYFLQSVQETKLSIYDASGEEIPVRH